MTPMSIGIIALVAIVAAFIGVALFDAFRPGPRAKKELRDSDTRDSGTRDSDTRDSDTCDHEWKTWESGACTTGYSSYGGPDPQEEWTIEVCSICGAKSFSCTGSSDCQSECDRF